MTAPTAPAAPAAAARWAAAGLAAELAALPAPALAEQVVALAMAGPALGWPAAWRRRHDLAALELARRVLAGRPAGEGRR